MRIRSHSKCWRPVPPIHPPLVLVHTAHPKPSSFCPPSILPNPPHQLPAAVYMSVAGLGSGTQRPGHIQAPTAKVVQAWHVCNPPGLAQLVLDLCQTKKHLGLHSNSAQLAGSCLHLLRALAFQMPLYPSELQWVELVMHIMIKPGQALGFTIRNPSSIMSLPCPIGWFMTTQSIPTCALAWMPNKQVQTQFHRYVGLGYCFFPDPDNESKGYTK